MACSGPVEVFSSASRTRQAHDVNSLRASRELTPTVPFSSTNVRHTTVQKEQPNTQHPHHITPTIPNRLHGHSTQQYHTANGCKRLTSSHCRRNTMTLLHAAETALSTPSSSLKILVLSSGMVVAAAAAPSFFAAAKRSFSDAPKARSTAAHAARSEEVRASSSLRAEFTFGLGYDRAVR